MFPAEGTPEEIICSLADGDIIKMNVLRKSKVSEVRKLMITRSKQAFINWLNEPDPEADKENEDNFAG